MARSIILGNGNMLVGLDMYGQVRDLYFPYVGFENHTGGKFVHRVGVWTDGQLNWLDTNWNIDILCDTNSLIDNITAKNDHLQVSLHFEDIVYNEKDIFLRKVSIRNDADRKRMVKLYFHHEFEIYESHRGDSAFYDPKGNVIVHYNGRRVFLINGTILEKGFDDYTVGIFNIEGKEGSYVDAYDGELSKNPVEHGLTDSVIGFSMDMEAEEEKTLYYWVVAARSLKEAYQLNTYVTYKTPQHLLKTTKDFWTAWVDRYPFHLVDLDKKTAELFRKSLLMVRVHTDNRGAIIASCDSDMLQHGRDTYSYAWPRDGARVALALDMTGNVDISRRFFQFCNDLIDDQGYLMHKYRPDGSLGSSWHPWIRDGKYALPIQEDETALVIHALWEHYSISKDLEFVESVYNSMIKKAADFLVRYRDGQTGLPLPSYDLWEENYGVFTFTASSVYGALRAAARFADLLGKTSEAEKYNMTAEDVQKAILEHLYSPSDGAFYKMVNFKNGKKIANSVLDMSSLFGLVTFNVLDIDDPRLERFVELIKTRVCCDDAIGGAVRYEGDMYYRIAGTDSGNPWIITTLWLAQYYIAKAKTKEDFKEARKWIAWVVAHASPSGMLPEQIHPYTGEHLSAVPLTWSHAEFLITILQYLDRFEELGWCDDCNPVGARTYHHHS